MTQWFVVKHPKNNSKAMKNSKSIIKKYMKIIYALFNYFLFVINDLHKIKNCECLFFFPFYHTGGAERVHVNILKAINHKNCVVIFTMGSATKSFYYSFKNSAHVIELNPILNKRNKRINNQLQKSIVGGINSSKNIETIFGCNNSYYYHILPEVNKSIKKIDLFHAFEKNDSRIADVIDSAKIIDKRVAINHKAKDDIVGFYKLNNIDSHYINNIEIIQNGIELPENENYCKKENPIKIGFVGRWSVEKRPEIFLEIAQRLKIKFPHIEFVMAGTGMKSNIDLIKKAKVTFLGEITDEIQMNELYNSLHLILVTSVYEGFPMVMMEAMSHGVIPIATNVGGINEHIKHGENGLLINETDEVAIVNVFCENIINVLSSDIDKNRICKSAFEYAKNNFGIDKFNQSYKEIFIK